MNWEIEELNNGASRIYKHAGCILKLHYSLSNSENKEVFNTSQFVWSRDQNQLSIKET